MKIQETIVALVAIVAVFSLPLVYALGPVLRDLVPLLYLICGIGAFTLAARHLLRYAHALRMEELRERRALAREERETYLEAERTLRRHGSPEGIAARAGLTEDELLRAAARDDGSGDADRPAGTGDRDRCDA